MKDYFKLPVTIVEPSPESGGKYVAIFDRQDIGIVASGETEQEMWNQLHKMFDASQRIHRQIIRDYHRRAILISNYSKRPEGGFSFWFRSIGIGMNIWRPPKSSEAMLAQSKSSVKWHRVGRIRFRFENEWKSFKEID